MRVHITGRDVPESLLKAFSRATNKAHLVYPEVSHDQAKGTVRLPIIRFPVLKRGLLGDVLDKQRPIQAMITVRNVRRCDVADHTSDSLAGKVQLLFGVSITDSEVFASSAEEDRGTTCYSITLAVEGLDIELADT